MIANSLQLCADRFSDRKDGLPDHPAAHILSGTITGDSAMKFIPLTQGKFAIVDDEDFAWLNQWKWYLLRKPNTFYASRPIKIDGKTTSIKMHRQILRPPVHLEIDHRNSNGLDNQRDNLRVCTRSQNQQNRKKKCNCSSIYKGVCWSMRDGKWETKIRFKYKQIHLGNFSNEIEAAKTYDKAAKELFGEFANLNFPRRENQ